MQESYSEQNNTTDYPLNGGAKPRPQFTPQNQYPHYQPSSQQQSLNTQLEALKAENERLKDAVHYYHTRGDELYTLLQLALGNKVVHLDPPSLENGRTDDTNA